MSPEEKAKHRELTRGSSALTRHLKSIPITGMQWNIRTCSGEKKPSSKRTKAKAELIEGGYGVAESFSSSFKGSGRRSKAPKKLGGRWRRKVDRLTFLRNWDDWRALFDRLWSLPQQVFDEGGGFLASPLFLFM